MDDYRIGTIKRPIVFWTGTNMEDGYEWGQVGMMVIIKGLSDNHYNIADPAGLLEPIFALRQLIVEVPIEFKRIR